LTPEWSSSPKDRNKDYPMMVGRCLRVFGAVVLFSALLAGCSGYGTPPAAYTGASEPGRQDYAPPYYWGAPKWGTGGRV
jgi:hypothetical protein